ncbi:putative Zn-binding protein involved in type VI secretion [Spinactinospora alkalitolerans]|uniref:Putative Zn-binding protein involved in type VI secretion n=1 Tax=Spinactinospora alkalitolerans TaxID=687207 RepID=A0A852U371_9ACTN|nr:chaplin family protein [Spinactinospora alkalitolerans]NYE49955.1 putative Zn-binding protein involved in type VI secretion [Spinactinospora alkalitolerans]
MLKKTFAAGAVAAAAAGVLFTATPAFAVDDVETSGDGSVLSGNQVVVDADAPVNVCGNAIAIIGNAGAYCEDSGAAVIEHHSHWHKW